MQFWMLYLQRDIVDVKKVQRSTKTIKQMDQLLYKERLQYFKANERDVTEVYKIRHCMEKWTRRSYFHLSEIVEPKITQ